MHQTLYGYMIHRCIMCLNQIHTPADAILVLFLYTLAFIRLHDKMFSYTYYTWNSCVR